MSNFHVGQVVVCVDDSGFTGHHLQGNRPIRDQVYTVREVRKIPNCEGSGLLLHELVNPVVHFIGFGQYEPGFISRRFRPAVKTDISIFTEMLNKRPYEVQA